MILLHEMKLFLENQIEMVLSVSFLLSLIFLVFFLYFLLSLNCRLSMKSETIIL